MSRLPPHIASLRLVIICGILTVFPALSIDLGLPGFASIATMFSMPIERVSQTLSFFFFSFSVSPLIYGPLSDRMGRRPVLLFACVVYTFASVLATLSTSFDMLLVCRLLQGTGAGAASVLAITVIRDQRSGDEARQLLSYAAVVRIIGPTTAPTLGNLLLMFGNWRWIYGFMALGGFLMLLIVARELPESSHAKLARADGHGAKLGGMHGLAPSEAAPARRSVLADYRQFLTDKVSLSYALIVALTFSSHFSYITGSLYVFVDVLHVSTTLYGLLFAVMALCLMLGSFVSARLGKHGVPGELVLAATLAVSVASPLTMLSLSAGHRLDVTVLTLLLSLNTTCLGILTPIAQQGAMERAAQFAGTASALMNALMTGMGACASYIEGVLLTRFPESPALVMSAQMTLCCLGGAAIFLVGILPAAQRRRAAG